MRAAERRMYIERELAITGQVSVSSLAAALAVSPVSIRRDLNVLVAQGVARRAYGRAIAVGRPGPTAGQGESTGGPEPLPSPRERRPARRSQAGAIGLIIPSTRYYYLRVLDGMKEAAAAARVPIAFANSGYSVAQEQEQIRRIIRRGVSALVVTPAQTPERDPSTYRLLQEQAVPVVLMERDGGDEFTDLDSVRSDHALGARLAFQRLADLGHRAVALVCAESTATAGWLQAGFDTKRPLFDTGRSEHLTIASAPEYEPAMQTRMDEILDRFASRGITGALVHSDVAAGVLAQRARERGVTIPAQLDLIAYDDEIAALADPPLDAIAPPKREVGRLALRLAVERSLEPATERSSQKVTVAPQLVLRAGRRDPGSR
ncbi:LacI family DNA-binding transcriptional regulator [Ruania zhangjianzhongii]|uniref:LacI family DNA-binding transcriptional regulator n=1 Tax=Ruania zhangjianzhongii TaxID=2603206 RepID=UPI00143D3334|nr:LacI family DNA-binding transcriptional regulator [Ruania zhangjianzhongii]